MRSSATCTADICVLDGWDGARRCLSATVVGGARVHANLDAQRLQQVRTDLVRAHPKAPPEVVGLPSVPQSGSLGLALDSAWSGGSGCTLVVDPSAAWGQGMEEDALLSYVASISDLARRRETATIWLYPPGRLPAGLRWRLLRRHRWVWVDGAVCQNIHHVSAPPPLPADVDAEAWLSRCLQQLYLQSTLQEELRVTVTRAQELMEARERELDTLQQMALGLQRSPCTDDLLASVVERVRELLDMDAGCILRLDGDSGILEPSAVHCASPRDGMLLETFHRSSDLCRRALESSRVEWGGDVEGATGGVRSFVAAPLSYRGRAWGVMLLSGARPRAFSLQEIQVVRTLASHVAATLEHDRVYRGYLEAEAQERELRERLGQSERLAMLGQLVSSVAHEVNNPLTSVLGFSELLASRPGLDADMRETLEIINSEARRASLVLSNLLKFSRKRTTRRTPLSLNEVVESCLRVRAHDLQLHGIEASLDLAPDLPPVSADVTGIQQVLMNLIGNARQAMHAHRGGGRLAIRTAREEGSVVVVVRDDGPGLPPHLIPTMFTPFVTGKPAGEGTGLGLSICRSIIREHCGTIDAHNADEGGAVFTVRLPATAPQEVDVPAACGEKAPVVSSLDVLLLEDDANVRRFVLQVLEHRGMRVRQAAHPDDALRMLGEAACDLVICDVRLPTISGFEVYRRLHARGLAHPFLFMTGDILNPEVRAFMKETGCRCLSKPFDPAALYRAVTEVVRADCRSVSTERG